MASLARCDKANGGDDIRCALDISSAIESVNGMVNVILKAVDACGDLNTENKECGLAVGVLTESWAGLSSASAGIVAKCPNKLNGGHPLNTVGQAMANAGATNQQWGNGNVAPVQTGLTNLQGGASFGQCIVNVKGTMKSLFKTIKRIMTLKHNCKDPASRKCAHNDLKIMSGLVGMGEYLSGAIGKCSPYNYDSYKTKTDAICAQYSLKLIAQLGVADRAGIAMSKACELTDDQRLYLEEETSDDKKKKKNESAVTLGLAGLLPFTAVVSFVMGKRFAKVRTVEPRDCEALVGAESE